MEEILNNTQTQKNNDFSNIRNVQDIVKDNRISSFAADIKTLKQRLENVGQKLAEKKKKYAEELKQKQIQETAAKEIQEKVSKPVEKPAIQTAKVEPASQQKPPVSAKPQEQYGNKSQNASKNFSDKDGKRQNGQNNGYSRDNNFRQGNNGGRERQNVGAKPQGRFTPTGARRFDPNSSERQGGYTAGAYRGGGNNDKNNRQGYGANNAQGFKKPFGQNSQKPSGLGSKLGTKETYAASTLVKNNRNVSQKKKSYDKNNDEKKSTLSKKALMMRGYAAAENGVDESEQNEQVSFKRHKKREENTVQRVQQRIDHAVITTDNLTVKILAETIGKSVPELMSKFLLLGMMVNINSNIDFESAELVSSEFGITLEKKAPKTFEEKLAESYQNITDDEQDLVKRPAVVCVLGHVDHGKTSLLDQIRKTNVVLGEAGGITQSIGAYQININNQDITFIDTPGHEAFSAMRARGAKLTDIAILVVAADDGVMPQTLESIRQIRQANVPMIVAINKIDVPKANIDNVKTQLTNEGVVPEEWGGDTIMVPISAKFNKNIDKLLEMVLFVAEYQNLRANPKRKAQGSIIEAKLDKGVGAVATVLVQNGTLSVGDYVVVGTCTGKIRAMMNDKREKIKSAGPSMPVQIIGLSGVPNAGDELYVVDEKMSKQVALERQNQAKIDMIKSADLSIENMMNKIADSNFKDYNVIVKADVQGSVEALKSSLSELKNEEVKVRFVSGGVGAVNENDVSLAQASNALIVAFNTKTDFKAKVLADKYKVEIKNSRIIYEVLDFVTEKINKMISPKYREVVTGHAEIRATFKASKVGLIAGTYVLDGKIARDNKVRVYRGEKLLFDGDINSIQREKNEAKDVDAGFECGVTFAGFVDFAVGDTFETYKLERIN